MYLLRRQSLPRHSMLRDGLVATALCVFTLAAAMMTVPSLHARLTPAATAVAVAGYAALVLRRRWPVTALAVTLAASEAFVALTHSQGAVVAAPLIAVYAVAESPQGRRRSLTIAAAAVLLLATVHMLSGPSSLLGTENLTLTSLGGLAIAAGDASRSRKAYIASMEERTRRAEYYREQEARRLLTEERLRIARDLHDAVGHRLALINVQAGAADVLAGTDVASARAALAHIRQAGRAALDDIAVTIGLLREPGEFPGPGDPGIDEVPQLIASFGGAGLRVDYQIRGQPRELPPQAGLAAFRIIQESLTNVRKHARSPDARVLLEFRPDTLTVTVRNHGPVAEPCSASGHGITGMRERAAAAGGRLDAGPRPGGGFAVRSVLPVQ
jgi:signal transduction histidine kinase